MTRETFETTLRAFQKRTPFALFIVEMVSGDRIRVDHPEALVVLGGVGVFLSSAGAPSIFDPDGISQITAASTGTAAA